MYTPLLLRRLTDDLCSLAMTFMFMQSKSSPKNERKNADGSSAEAAVCQICGKTENETAFSNKEKKRLDKGESAICKACLRAKYSAKVMPVR